MKTLTRFLLIAAVLLLPRVVPAESTPEAQVWLDGMKTIYEKGPFRLDYTVDMNMAQLGQGATMEMSGWMLYADPQHFRSEFEMSMGMPQAPAGGLTMKVVSVSDGETLWMDLNSPLMGGRQVMKMPLSKLSELSGVNPMVERMANMNPVSQLEEITRLFDFEVIDETEATVRLRARMTEEALRELGAAVPQGDTSALEEFVMVLDRESNFPRSMQVGGEQPLMTVTFGDVEFLDEVDASEFSFTPPEGVPLIDLGAAPSGPMGG